MELGSTITEAFAAYAEDVRAGRFPAPEHCYPIDPAAEAELRCERKPAAGHAVEAAS